MRIRRGRKREQREDVVTVVTAVKTMVEEIRDSLPPKNKKTEGEEATAEEDTQTAKVQKTCKRVGCSARNQGLSEAEMKTQVSRQISKHEPRSPIEKVQRRAF